MPSEKPPEAGPTIVWPTPEQVDKGLAEIERYAPHWKASPALLIIKPHFGLVVCLDSIKHDERYFALGLAVEEVIVAPEGFEEKVPITLKCVWNHPYMSMGADLISAPYSFYLHFGAQGVQRVRELSATRFFDKLRDSPMALGVLRASFESDIQVPGELSDDDNG